MNSRPTIQMISWFLFFYIIGVPDHLTHKIIQNLFILKKSGQVLQSTAGLKRCHTNHLWASAEDQKHLVEIQKMGKRNHPSSMSSSHEGAGVGNLCFLQSKVTPTVFQNLLEDWWFLLLWVCMEMRISSSSRSWPLPILPEDPKTWFNVH